MKLCAWEENITLKIMPETRKEKEQLFNQLLQYFDETGKLPDFKIIKK